jgi:hypothetical protein
MFLKLFHKIESRRIVPNFFYEASITIRPKSVKDMTKIKKITDQFP